MRRAHIEPSDPGRTRVVGYIRVSTNEQATEGVSLAAQRAKLTAYALALDLELVAIVEDAGLSAKTLDRPGLQSALGMLRGGMADGILVVKLDRLTRSVRDLGDLVETYFASKFTLLSVGDSIDTRSASGRMVLTILTTISQWEREAIGERTSAAMQHLRSIGAYTGGLPPYGFRLGDDGNLWREEAEQAVIEAARDLRLSGLSLRGIASELARIGISSRAGRVFDAQQVRRMLAA